MYLFSLMMTVILINYAKIAKNVAMTDNTIVHMKPDIINFILNSFLTKKVQNIFLLHEFHVLGS